MRVLCESAGRAGKGHPMRVGKEEKKRELADLEVFLRL